MINVIEQSTAERYNLMEKKYQEFHHLYYHTTTPVRDIRKQLNITVNSETYKYIKEKMKDIDMYQRATLIRKGEWL